MAYIQNVSYIVWSCGGYCVSQTNNSMIELNLRLFGLLFQHAKLTD